MKVHFGNGNGPICGARFQHDGLAYGAESWRVTCGRCVRVLGAKGSEPSSARYRRRMAELREAWGGRCVVCGVPHAPGAGLRLEFAHLPGKPTGLNGSGRGRSERYHDIRRNPDCYVLVCVEHHVELDGRGGGANRRDRRPGAAA
jgi:hypothetical protein